MQSFVLLALAAMAAVTNAVPTTNAPAKVDIVTGTAYTATFDEADAPNLQPTLGEVSSNRTYQGLNWTDVNLAIQKPSGTATTFFLIPESPAQYGQIPPVFKDLANFTRVFSDPTGVLSSAKKNEKIQLNGFYYGCSLPELLPGYFNRPIDCTVTVTGSGGIGGQVQTIFNEYKPVIGDCLSLGSTSLQGGGCARLAYVDAQALSFYGPYDTITISAPASLNPNSTRTSVFIDDVSYTTHKVAV